MKKMVVVTARVLTAPKVEQLEGEDGLSILQGVVGGLIETAGRKRIGHISLDAYCNEEGLLIGLPANRLVDGTPVVGDVVISAADTRTGDSVDMDEKLVLEAMKWAKTWPMAIPATLTANDGKKS